MGTKNLAPPGHDHLEHERLTSLINSMADGVIAVDASLKVVTYNGAALNILDRNSSMNGKSIASVFKPIDKNNQPINVIEFLSSVKTPIVNRDLRLKYADGSFMNLYLGITPVHRGYGKNNQDGYVLVVSDITHEKSLEEERDEFISVVSHELRTPIAIAEASISNAQFTTTKTNDVEQVKQSLKEAHAQIMFLAGMINDLATLSRAERGKLTVDIENINVHELVAELVKTYQKEAAEKGLKLSSDIDPQLELLKSSQLYVHEILQNFITNAIKYTETGEIVIAAKQKPGGVLFSIQDTGIGISRSDQERIFDKFFRSEDFRTRKTSGTGLGLYVTLKLARLLHADISVKSELNHGSNFLILVPNLE